MTQTQFVFSEQQKKVRSRVRDFTNQYITPYSDEFAEQQCIPNSLMTQLKANGMLGSLIPESYGGSNLDYISYGLINEEIAFGCSSVRSLLTVHDMVCHAILIFGTDNQRSELLPQLTQGSYIAAFALSELNAGTNIQAIQTILTPTSNGYQLNGCKKWVTFGQIADLFLVFVKLQGQGAPVALLIPNKRKGVNVTPVKGMLGTRSAMLAEIVFHNVDVTENDFLGKIGDGFAFVGNTALTLGRYSVAWGAVGLAHTCYQTCYRYVKKRKQGAEELFQHQLVRSKLSAMLVNLHAARLLCCQAGELLHKSVNRANSKVLMAKYFSTKSAEEAAENAVLLHGAVGLTEQSRVNRWLFDAKVGVIIEGNNDLHLSLLAEIVDENAGN